MKAWALSAGLVGMGLLLASQKTAQPGQAQYFPVKNPLKLINLDKDYAAMYSKIRGLRNNNPGNIERTKTKWQGMAEDQSGDSRFIVFESPEWGIRALGRVLVNYQRLHGINTVKGIIDRWAPPHENDTGSYTNAVARSLGVMPGQTINVEEHLLTLTKAIIKHENGIQPYSDALIKDGLAMV